MPDERGVLNAASFRVHLLAERLAPLWLVTALAMVLIQSANAAGVPVTRLVGGGGIGSALGASEMARGCIVVAIAAGVVTVALRLTVRWVWHAALVIPTSIGAIALPVSGNAGQGPDFFSVNVRLSRAFPIRGRAKVEALAEVFNLTNTPQFSNPGTNAANYNPNPAVNTFGVITGAGGGRTLQLGMKFNF